MNHTTTIPGGLSARSRVVGIAIAATLALALPAAAQDTAETASPAPAVASPAAETTAPAAESAAPAVEESGIAFPVMVGGQLLTPQTYTGTEWLAQFSEGDEADATYADDTEALVERAGATLDDLTVKTAIYEPAPGEASVIAALRIDGTEARTWVRDAVGLMVGDVVEPRLVMRPLDTKWTLRVTSAAMPGVYPRTVYLKDDTAWIVQGETDFVWDALGQLPDADPVRASSADSLYTDVPLTLGGVRRIGLYESTEPLFLPTLGERLGGGIEDWLLDLYLDAGISPAQMLGVITWWGLEAAQDGIQIEGYRLPEGGEDMIQELLEDVFLVRPPEEPDEPDLLEEQPVDDVAALFEGVSFTEGEIAGRAVTTLDYGEAKQHILGSEDTIWVISDPLGQQALVEEAIAALP